MTDTERLDFLLRFIHVDDVGDEEACCGVVVNQEGMEEQLGFGPMVDGRALGLATWGEDMRSVIDKAITAHSANAPDQARVLPSPESGCSVAELTDGIQQAISMLMEHIDKYHDCDVPENTEGPPERKALQNIMYHLMGTITPNVAADLRRKENDGYQEKRG